MRYFFREEPEGAEMARIDDEAAEASADLNSSAKSSDVKIFQDLCSDT